MILIDGTVFPSRPICEETAALFSEPCTNKVHWEHLLEERFGCLRISCASENGGK